MNQKIRVLLVDDHSVVSQGVKSFLESFDDIEVIEIAQNGEDAIRIANELQPQVVVVDLLMPGGIDGVKTTQIIRESSPLVQVVALTASTDQSHLIAVLRAGAIGYVRKDADPELLLTAIRSAVRGQSIIDRSVADVLLKDLKNNKIPGNSLTERETMVLRELAQGHTNKKIGEILFISEETVKTHIGNILSKLHLTHRTQAVIYAFKQGIISLDDI